VEGGRGNKRKPAEAVGVNDASHRVKGGSQRGLPRRLHRHGGQPPADGKGTRGRPDSTKKRDSFLSLEKKRKPLPSRGRPGRRALLKGEGLTENPTSTKGVRKQERNAVTGGRDGTGGEEVLRETQVRIKKKLETRFPDKSRKPKNYKTKRDLAAGELTTKPPS